LRTACAQVPLAHNLPVQSPANRRLGSDSPRIIIADDDRDTVDTLSAILSHAGYTVHGVYSGKEVLPIARVIRPDAIILDISVPGMSGYAVAHEIRHSFTEARRPLMIAITGIWNEASDRNIAHQVGFDHHFAKPCDPERILRLLEPLKRPAR
jgi:CheY-like chemotaxis protein